jgi:hypothetical protein
MTLRSMVRRCMRVTVIALGAVLFSSAFADGCVEPERDEPTEPHDQADPAYIGKCQSSITLKRPNDFSFTVSGEPAWGGFTARGALYVWRSTVGADGPIVRQTLLFDGPEQGPLAVDLSHPPIKYIEKVTQAWCHAYRNEETHNPDPDTFVDDFKYPDYLGHCTTTASQWRDGTWHVRVDGDPTWGNFHARISLEVMGSEQGPNGVFGAHYYVVSRYRSMFNRTPNNHHPWHTLRAIEAIRQVFCHAFQGDPAFADK